MSQIKPQGNRVLVEPIKAEATKGGILLPESAREKPKEGKVLAIGPGKRHENGHLEPIGVEVGDVICYSTYSGTEFTLQGRDYLIVANDEILGTLL